MVRHLQEREEEDFIQRPRVFEIIADASVLPTPAALGSAASPEPLRRGEWRLNRLGGGPSIMMFGTERSDCRLQGHTGPVMRGSSSASAVSV